MALLHLLFVASLVCICHPIRSRRLSNFEKQYSRKSALLHARTSAQAKRLSSLVNRAQAQKRSAPFIGNFEKRFRIDRFLDRGGQADVWLGRDLLTNQKVVFRFPLGLCEGGSGRCRVEELDKDQLRELRFACSLANRANERLRVHERNLPFLQKKHPHRNLHAAGFVKCIEAVSTEPEDPAFDVWSFAGEVTLGQAFFTKTCLGELTLEQKHGVLATLQNSIAVLSAAEPSDGPCCCLKTNHDVCTTEPDLNMFRRNMKMPCPKGYEHIEGACGAIVHHDIKFENVMMSCADAGLKEPKATLIDFGGATTCKRGWTESYSLDFVPPWLRDPLSFSMTECWSYDTYALGMLVLVTRSLHGFASNGSCISLSTSAVAEHQASVPDTECASRNMDRLNTLLHDLHTTVLTLNTLKNPDDLRFRLFHFVNNATVRSEDIRSLDLVEPSYKEINQNIYPLLRECPNHPFVEGEHGYSNAELGLHDCLFRVSSRNWHEAISSNDRAAIETEMASFEKACVKLVLLRDVTDPKFREVKDKCKFQKMHAIMLMMSTGDIHGLQQILTASPDPMYWFLPDGESLLAAAARARSVEIVRLFLDHGADPLSVGTSPQQLSVGQHASVTEVNDIVKSVPLPAVLAAASRPYNAEVLSLLLRPIHRVNAVAGLRVQRDADGHHTGPGILSFVAQQGDTVMLALVLERLKGAKLPSERSRTKPEFPVHVAAAAGHWEACAMLSKWGFQAYSLDATRRSPFSYALQSGSTDTIKVLAAATPGVVSVYFPIVHYPLDFALARGDAATMETLVALGADMSQCSDLQDSQLHRAVSAEYMPQVRILAKDKQMQRSANKFGEVALAVAVRRCANLELLDLLLDDAPEDVLNSVNAYGYTPLMIAASLGHVECLRMLLLHVPVDSRGGDLRTALMVAAKYDQKDTIHVLIQEFEADPMARDEKLVPVSMYTRSSTTYQALIDAAGPEVMQTADGNGLSVFGIWAFEGNVKMVRKMLESGSLDCNSFVTAEDFALPALLDGHEGELTEEPARRTALWLTRKRLEVLLEDRVPQRHAVLMDYRTSKWAKAKDREARDRMIEKLSNLQVYLESEDCDGQGSSHIE